MIQKPQKRPRSPHHTAPKHSASPFPPPMFLVAALLRDPLAAERKHLDVRTNANSSHRPTRSHYALSRQEIARGVANRFVHSRTYIFLYLGMAALSITTVILSLQDGCPGLAFYILEFIINVTMIAEVSVRLVAFGRVSAIS